MTTTIWTSADYLPERKNDAVFETTNGFRHHKDECELFGVVETWAKALTIVVDVGLNVNDAIGQFKRTTTCNSSTFFPMDMRTAVRPTKISNNVVEVDELSAKSSIGAPREFQTLLEFFHLGGGGVTEGTWR